MKGSTSGACNKFLLIYLEDKDTVNTLVPYETMANKNFFYFQLKWLISSSKRLNFQAENQQKVKPCGFSIKEKFDLNSENLNFIIMIFKN